MNQQKIIILFLVITVAVVFGLVMLQGQGSTISEVVLTEEGTVLGAPNGSIVLTEFSDFQCPACAFYWPLIEQLEKDFPQDLKVVYKHFPLRSIHPNADISAQASEAAGLQGKFSEMAGLLFSKQGEWKDSKEAKKIFEGYAGQLGLDLARFSADIDSVPVKAKVQKNFEEAQKLNLPGTPSFFLNGKKIQNPYSYPEFKNIISDAIKK